MTEFRPEVVIIEKIEKHPNADFLDICTVVNDYPVITKAGEFALGEKVGYIPIDAIVPSTEQFHFLSPKKYIKVENEGEITAVQDGFKYNIGEIPEKFRIIKAKVIRDIYSQGLLVKVNQYMNVGDSIVELFDLKKYESAFEEENIVSAKLKGKNAEKPPSGWAIPYYDIESVRKYFSLFKETDDIVITEKIHGSNISVCYNDRLYVKSRSLYKKKDYTDSWWRAAIDMGLEDKIIKYPRLVFFGELIGYNKKFPYNTITDNVVNPKIIFFDIYSLDTRQYLDYEEFVKICNDLELETVPVLYKGPMLDKDTIYEYAEGKSLLNNSHIREGIVIKTLINRYEPKLNSRLFLKLIGKGFNLMK